MGAQRIGEEVRPYRLSVFLCLLLAVACGGGGDGEDDGGDPGGGGGGGGIPQVVVPNPILFVTQVPVKSDWAMVTSTMTNHKPGEKSAFRGGDLYILYTDGTLKNLTQAAGYGVEGFQIGPNAIAVRGPCVHWDGAKAVFSMVRGAHDLMGAGGPYTWQLYEITGLGAEDTPVIAKVPHQPANYNNVDPVYASDDRILFASDRPRDGSAHLHPQLDEYNSMPTVTGLWSLDPVGGQLKLLNHAPSGVYRPSVDSYGRVVYSSFDHLTRDKQPNVEIIEGEDLGAFNYTGEAPGSVPTASDQEWFPEANTQWVDWLGDNPGYSGPLYGHEPQLIGQYMGRFLPWTMNQDGTEAQTINRIGEHELGDLGNAGAYANFTLNPSLNDDSNLEFIPAGLPFPTQNTTLVRHLLQVREDPAAAGFFYGVDARFHDTHAAGKLLRFYAPLGLSADQVLVQELTHPTTANPYASLPSGHTGFYRNPLPLSDGTLVAVHTDDYRKEEDLPGSPIFGAYGFKLVELVAGTGGYLTAGESLTGGIQKDCSVLLDSYQAFHYGDLWELDPVEVVARPRPSSPAPTLATPESQALAAAGVSLTALQNFLVANDCALIVSRNVTSRDQTDHQQPYNLRVPGTGTQSIGSAGTIYDVSDLQVFQANLLRGYDGVHMYFESAGGRRVLAQPQTDVSALNPPNPGGPAGSVAIADDGSVAALVPARRALTWQLTDPVGEPVVRERYWFSLQAGEIRSCTSCHDPSAQDQIGRAEPHNPPLALYELLQHLVGQGAL